MLDAVAGQLVPLFGDAAQVVDRVCWRPVPGAGSYVIERDGRPVGTGDAAQRCWTGPVHRGARYRVVPDTGRAVDAVPSRFRVVGTTIEPDAAYVNDLALDRTGRVWMGTRGCAITRFDGAWRAEPIPTGCGNDGVRSIAVAADQTLWMHVDDVGVVRFDPATERWWVYPGASEGGRDPLGADGLGNVWFAGPGSLLREGGPGGSVALPTLPEGCGVRSASASPNGAVWVGTRCGLLRLGAGEAVRYDAAAGIADEVAQVAVAADGVVWVQTARPHTDPPVRVLGSVDPATGAWSPATEAFARGATLRVTDGVARVVDGARLCTAAGTVWSCAPGPDALPNGVAVGPDVWLSRGRVARRADGVWQRVNRDPPAPSATVLPLVDFRAWDGHAVAWLYARGRAWRAEDGRGLTESLDLKALVGKPYMPDLHEDASGGVWALAERALLRRDPGGAFRAVDAPLGGGEAALGSVERGGAAWITDTFLLARLTPDANTTTALQAPWTRMLAGGGRLPDCASVTVPGRGDLCVSIEATGQDADGRPLVWTDQGMLDLDPAGVPRALIPVPAATVEQLGAAPDGTRWAAGRSGLWVRTGAEWARVERPPAGVVTGALPASGGTWWLFTSPGVWSGPRDGPWTQRAGFWADPLGIDAAGGVWTEEHNSPRLVRRWEPATGSWSLPLEELDSLLDADAVPSPLGGAALPEKLLLGGPIDGFVAGALSDLHTEGHVTTAREGVWRLQRVR